MTNPEPSPDETQRQALHELATLFGLLGMRWYVIKHDLLAEAAGRAEIQEMDSTLTEIRLAFRKLIDQRKSGSSSE